LDRQLLQSTPTFGRGRYRGSRWNSPTHVHPRKEQEARNKKQHARRKMHASRRKMPQRPSPTSCLFKYYSRASITLFQSPEASTHTRAEQSRAQVAHGTARTCACRASPPTPSRTPPRHLPCSLCHRRQAATVTSRVHHGRPGSSLPRRLLRTTSARAEPRNGSLSGH